MTTRRMSFGAAAGSLCIALLVVLGSFGFAVPGVGVPESHSSAAPPSPALVSGARPHATSDAISIAGYDSTEVALSWAKSGDFCFNGYTIQYATQGNNGPWTIWSSFGSGDASITALIAGGFTPGETVWWQDIDLSGCGGGQQPSNVVSLTFPSYPIVSYSDSSTSTVALSWTNTGSYGGLLSFQNYWVQKDVNGAGFLTIANITSESAESYSATGITGLNSGTKYQFLVVAVDVCNGCSGGTHPNWIESDVATHLTIDQPTSSPASVQVGKTVQLSVSALGGTGPYSYNWLGLPAGCSSSDSNSISCSPTSTGTSSVTVVVTDSLGIVLTSLPVSVSVTAAASSGNGSGGNNSTGPGGSGGTGGPTAAFNPASYYVVGGVAIAVVIAILAVVLLTLRRNRPRNPAT